MTGVRPPCGTASEMSAELVGRFPPRPVRHDDPMAVPPEASGGAAPVTSRKRLGDLAVERGFVSREHVELCAEYQKALIMNPHGGAKRLGEILVEKGLLEPNQLAALLSEQRGVAATWLPGPPKPASHNRPEPAAKPEGRAAARFARLRRPLPRWARWAELGLLLVVGTFGIGCLWPGPPAQRTLETYLRGCRENAAQKTDFLAVRDLGIEVYQFSVEAVLPAVEHEYAPDIRNYCGTGALATWGDFPKSGMLPAAKRRALDFILPILPLPLKPHRIDSLVITVQPIRVLMFYRKVGDRLFRHERCMFSVVRLDSPHWTFGWRVAGYEPLEPPSK